MLIVYICRYDTYNRKLMHYVGCCSQRKIFSIHIGDRVYRNSFWTFFHMLCNVYPSRTPRLPNFHNLETFLESFYNKTNYVLTYMLSSLNEEIGILYHSACCFFRDFDVSHFNRKSLCTFAEIS